MSEAERLIEKTKAVGVILRIGLVADDWHLLADDLKAAIGLSKAEIVFLLARNIACHPCRLKVHCEIYRRPNNVPNAAAAPGNVRRISNPIKLRERAEAWEPVEDVPATGDYCAECGGQMFKETDHGWECDVCVSWLNKSSRGFTGRLGQMFARTIWCDGIEG